MLALGSMQQLIVNSIAKHKIEYDLCGFLENVALADLNQNGVLRNDNDT